MKQINVFYKNEITLQNYTDVNMSSSKMSAMLAVAVAAQGFAWVNKSYCTHLAILANPIFVFVRKDPCNQRTVLCLDESR